jgi:hypothetical protein
MRDNGFSTADYDVMEKSCNSFTKELSRRLKLLDRYPSGVLTQSKLGEILSPLARALDLLPDQQIKGAKQKGKRFFVVPSSSSRLTASASTSSILPRKSL